MNPAAVNPIATQPDPIDLVPMDVAGRESRVRGAMVAAEVEALFVSKPVNVRWLTGFTGSNGAVLIDQRGLTLFTDDRYEEQASLETAAFGIEVDIVLTRTTEAEVGSRIGHGTTGIESHHLTLDRSAALSATASGAHVQHVGPLVDQLRQQKDRGEVARLRSAAQIADRALADHEDELLGGGMTEQAFARSLERAMYSHGADALSFDTIVASGSNSSRPHARPSSRVMEAGDLVVIDFGASVDGYGSDMTRTFVCGGQPTPDQEALYDAVLSAQAAGIAAVCAGADQVSIDHACRSVLAANELADAFIHGTGHGIGLEIHEQPILSARSVGILAADLVVTVEPGAYVPGRGGVRVEDSVLVTADGCDPITHFPKGLVPWPLFRPTT